MTGRFLFVSALTLSIFAGSNLLLAGSGTQTDPSGSSAQTGSTGSSAQTGSTGSSTSGSGTTGTTDRTRQSTSTGEARGTTSGSADVRSFVQDAAQAGLAEVDLGKLAQNKATRAEVKDFAKMMVTDHTKANEELKTLATQKKLAVPKSMGDEHAKTQAMLKKMTGTKFDTAYMNAMVKDHEKAVQLFQQASTSLSDPDLKAWAAKTLPTLQAHLDQAKKLHGGNTDTSKTTSSTTGSSNASGAGH